MDNKPSRAAHDSSGKHKGAVQFHIRNIEKKNNEKAEEEKIARAVLGQVEAEARIKFAEDIQAGHGGVGKAGVGFQASGVGASSSMSLHGKGNALRRGGPSSSAAADSPSALLPAPTIVPEDYLDVAQLGGTYEDISTMPGQWEAVEIIRAPTTTVMDMYDTDGQDTKVFNDSKDPIKAIQKITYDDDDQDPDDLQNYKITEKVVEFCGDDVDEDANSTTNDDGDGTGDQEKNDKKNIKLIGFKKRKFGNSSGPKGRNARKKLE